ncbi:MAG: CDP-glucose 4,6-dehydratase [Clostridia bacterium]|nr:CDP-glucose 4,6-dehydratase [Clostridia bacterium]
MNNFYNGKSVLVTGHTGFKGSWLCKALIMFGAKVTGYALEPATNPNLFELSGIEGRMKSVIGDVRDYAALKAVFDEVKPEIVFHLAAQPIVREGYKSPLYTYETNVMGTVNLLECVRNCDSVRSVLNVTTDKVYKNFEVNRGYREDEQLDGYDPYSNSKSCSELVTHCYKNSYFDEMGIAVSTARAGNVIGGGDFAEDRIIPDCCRAALNGSVVSLRNPGSIRPYQHVLEPIYAYMMIAYKQYSDSEKSGWYNIGPDDCDCITTRELVSLFSKYWGDDFSWETIANDGPHESGILKLDCAKIKETFGWKPMWNVEKAVKKTVEWFKMYKHNAPISDFMNEQIKTYFDEQRDFNNV